MNQKIAIDVREATAKNKAGKGIYNLKLTAQLILNQDYKWILLTDDSTATLQDFYSGTHLENVDLVYLPEKGFKWHLAVKKYLKKNPVNFYLAMTSFITPYLLKNLPVKSIIFVHDLICFLYAKGHPLKPKLIERFFLPRIIKSVSAIFCVSENTTSDLTKLFPSLDQQKIHLAECGYESSLANPVLEKPLKENYILSVSTILPRKNYQTLIQAFAKIQNFYTGKLVIIGSKADPKYFAQLEALVKSLNLTDKVDFKGFVSAAELNSYYSNADLFVYPSLYEGFGIPLLEAMSQNCPVVCANSSSLPSVARHAALYFEPLDSNKLAENISQILAQPELRQQLIQAGQARVKDFSWQKTAEEVLQVL